MTEIPQHSSLSVEHYTPEGITAAARRVMGGIDLDPATTKHVNDGLIGACNYFTKEDDGLNRPWSGRVWLNPPGGKTKNKSNAAIWWSKLSEEYLSGRVTEALFLGFTLEILATSQDASLWIGDLPFCVPRHRLEFYKETESGTYERGGSPPHSNVVVYLPPIIDRTNRVEDFDAQFSVFGRVSIPREGWHRIGDTLVCDDEAPITERAPKK